MLVKKCLYCGKEFNVYKCNFDKSHYCSKKCYYKSLIGKKSCATGKHWKIKDTSKMHHIAWNNHYLFKNCKICGKKFHISPCHIKTKYYCSLNCYNISKNGKPSPLKGRKGHKSWNKGTMGIMKAWNKGISGLFIGDKANHWKGGISFNNGYRCIFNNGKYILEQRLVAEKKIGRKLTKYEIVHHIDKDKLNNNPENLYLFKNQRYHAKYHNNPYPLTSNII